MDRLKRLGFLAPAALTLVLSGYAASCAGGSQRRGSAADSLVLADSAVRRCASVSGDARQTCYEGILLPLVASEGVPTAMGTLHRLAALDASVQVESHVYAHGIGITAGKMGGDVGRTFASCTEIFQSGCYHGVIQAYFETVPAVDAQTVNRLCQRYSEPGADRWLRFQCVHGIGHGLTMFYAHDLPRALAGCDSLADTWDRNSCYGGAFMENIVNATEPHNLSSGLHNEHAGHGGAAAAASPPFKALDPNDLHYPCSIMAQRYLAACYMMQTSVMMRYTNQDIAATSRACLLAPGRMRYDCHQSLGRDISPLSGQRHDVAIRMCAQVDPAYEPWCHIGVVKNFIDLTAKADDGISYCAELTGDPNRYACYAAVGEQIFNLRPDPDGRTQLCAHVDQAYRIACAYGARLTLVEPVGIPQEREQPAGASAREGGRRSGPAR